MPTTPVEKLVTVGAGFVGSLFVDRFMVMVARLEVFVLLMTL